MTWAETACSVMFQCLVSCREQNKTPDERKKFFATHGLPRKGDYKTTAQRVDDLVSKMCEERGWKKLLNQFGFCVLSKYQFKVISDLLQSLLDGEMESEDEEQHLRKIHDAVNREYENTFEKPCIY